MSIEDIVSKDIKTHTNEKGGRQSHIPVRFDLIDGKALFAMAAVLHEGAEKYGENNWRLIEIEDHLNHLIMHAYAWLSGDQTDEHLSHALCRAMFAQGVDLQEDNNVIKPKKEDNCLSVWHMQKASQRSGKCSICNESDIGREIQG